MRIGVIGAGGVGTTLAALLADGGHELHVAVRSHAVDVLARDGLHVRGAFGDVAVPVAAATTLVPDLDLVLCATQAQDAAAALAANAAAIGDTPVVMLQNGLRGPETARAVLGRSTGVLGALVLFAATGTAPGAATVTARGSVFVGAGEGWAPSDAREIAAHLSAVLPAEPVDRFVGAQWTKLLVNHVNAIPAITGTSVQAVSRDRALCHILTRSMREAIAVARARHVRFAPLGPLDPASILALERQPIDRAAHVARRLGLSFGRTPNPASMLQAIRRGRRTEVDELNGRVVELAGRSGPTTSVEALLTSLVHRVERTGRFVAPGELVARARALP